MKEKHMNKSIKEDFIKDVIDNSRSVTIFLINGVKLTGKITKQDEGSVLLTRDGITQMVQIAALATVMPLDM